MFKHVECTIVCETKNRPLCGWDWDLKKKRTSNFWYNDDCSSHQNKREGSDVLWHKV